uniref:Uncharacterized protein n=1 Tax=Onchocerca volvulus TaxID=6282 RepID=A0A8R1Y0R0_ONCVO
MSATSSSLDSNRLIAALRINCCFTISSEGRIILQHINRSHIEWKEWNAIKDEGMGGGGVVGKGTAWRGFFFLPSCHFVFLETFCSLFQLLKWQLLSIFY